MDARGERGVIGSLCGKKHGVEFVELRFRIARGFRRGEHSVIRLRFSECLLQFWIRFQSFRSSRRKHRSAGSGSRVA